MAHDIDSSRAAGNGDAGHPARWWRTSGDGGNVVCELCPRGCTLSAGRRGFCFVRRNDAGKLVSTTYGRSTGFCIDPIEKKPLFHFYPGTGILSFGTAGCNLGCVFCQNWSTSKAKETDVACEPAQPRDIARTARALGCRSVAFTYNEPTVWAEYAIDTARECRGQGIHTVAVTAGYIAPAARREFFDVIDAANVDLKGFSDDFYRTMAAGQLEPVLDTLRWLVHESTVWLEITNLLIPGANDAPETVRAMCEWIVRELRPDVPLHFSAFHPDYRLTDRGPTPPATVEAACRIARECGLRYVYAGNIHDTHSQNTHCVGCGELLIQRSGYTLGKFAVRRGGCPKCGAALPGKFDDAAGDWGSRRQPVHVRQFDADADTVVSTKPGRKTAAPATRAADTAAAAPEVVSQRPHVSPEQEQAIYQAAGRVVAATVCRQPIPRGGLAEALAGLSVLGTFVSLKRAGKLRSCCGSMGTVERLIALGGALEEAAIRAAKDDPRFPPIAADELLDLEMEVWLLWGIQPVEARRRDRVDAVEIGKHGLQIARGRQRGLLLPSVAVDHNLDARGFLRQVCLKAGLPDDAWLDDDTTLWTFEGRSIKGKLATTLAEQDTAADTVVQQPPMPPGLSQPGPGPGPGQADVSKLAELCRGNVVDMLHGATPSYYLPEAFDGNVCGAILSVRLASQPETYECSQISLRPEVPLQASLTPLCEAMARMLRSLRAAPDAIARMRLGLTVLWDPRGHGAFDAVRDCAINTKHRAVAVAQGSRWAVVYDCDATTEGALEAAATRGRVDPGEPAEVYSMAVASTVRRSTASNVPMPQLGAAVRPPAVAGQFYPGNAAELGRMLDTMLAGDAPRGRWAGAMTPHAGWVYSGRLAADVLRRAEIPSRVIVVCPKHHSAGADWAVAPHRVWALPGREVASDPELAAAVAKAVDGFELDAQPHRQEHAIEVQLPIVARLAPETRVVGIALGAAEPPRLQRAADQLAKLLESLPERPLLVISTDMNHFADDAYTRRIDRLARDAIERRDPEGLYRTVREHRISMCGVVPAVFVMQTLRRLGALSQCEPVGYATSAEASGDTRRVVGYAGYLFR